MAIETATVRERIAVVDPFTNFYEPHISFEMARAALCSVYTHDASRRSKAIFDTARSVVSVIRGKLNGDEDGDPSDDR